MRGQMERLGLSFRFFDAYRPETLPQSLRGQFFDDRGKPHEDILFPGEIGCYASHLAVLQLLAEGQVEGPVLVLEDDAILSREGLEKIAVIVKALQQNPTLFEYVNLYHDPFRCAQGKLELSGKLTLIKPFYCSNRTVG